MAVTIQLKRGTSAAWQKLDPILAVGEPGFEKDTNRLKIGDGIKSWNNLPYQDANSLEVFNAETASDFPEEGKPNMIYRASKNAELYQWNPALKNYELLNAGGEFTGIQIINGGNANG